MSPLLVVGSANLDLVFNCKHFPQAGETVLGGNFTTFAGGKGANQSVAAARAGTPTTFCGCIGQDNFGDLLLDSLRQAGVDLEHLSRTMNAATGTACILVDQTGENEIVVAPGANSCMDAAKVEHALSTVKAAITVAQLEIPLEAVQAASQSDRFILNPAPAQHLSSSLLEQCWILTPNREELAQISGCPTDTHEDVVSAAQKTRDSGVQNVIVTLGDKGCLWVGEEVRHFPAHGVTPVDTTGAGDAFTGSLAAYLAQGIGLEQAIQRANAFAALSTTQAGAQASMPTQEELERFLSSSS